MGKRMHCIKGHLYTYSNSRWRKRGDLMIRDCRLCEAARDRLRYQNNPRRQASVRARAKMLYACELT